MYIKWLGTKGTWSGKDFNLWSAGSLYFLSCGFLVKSFDDKHQESSFSTK